MFVRKVSVRLKPDAGSQFLQKMEEEIIPLLRKQKGFLNELTLISRSGKEFYSYTFWESAEDAVQFERTASGEITSQLEGLLDGAVRVNTYSVANATFHMTAIAAAS